MRSASAIARSIKSGRAGRTLAAFSTTPSAPANEASRHLVYVAATPPRRGGVSPAQELVVSSIDGLKPRSILHNKGHAFASWTSLVYDRPFYSGGTKSVGPLASNINRAVIDRPYSIERLGSNAAIAAGNRYGSMADHIRKRNPRVPILMEEVHAEVGVRHQSMVRVIESVLNIED